MVTGLGQSAKGSSSARGLCTFYSCFLHLIRKCDPGTLRGFEADYNVAGCELFLRRGSIAGSAIGGGPGGRVARGVSCR